MCLIYRHELIITSETLKVIVNFPEIQSWQLFIQIFEEQELLYMHSIRNVQIFSRIPLH